MKYMFVVANYADWKQEFYNDLLKPRNKEYCHKHGYEYVEFGEEGLFRITDEGPWKFIKVQEWLNNGRLQDGDEVMQIDADMCIVDGSCSMPCNKSFTYAIDSCNTHCMGLSTFRVNDWSRRLFELLLSEERYNKFNDYVSFGSMGETSSFWRMFREQASWYSLAGIKRHSQTSFFLLKDWGWHSNGSEYDTMYSLEELHKHVEVLPPCWNVTHIPAEDGGNQFYINPTHSQETVIRHFAAGRSWRKEYLERPMKNDR